MAKRNSTKISDEFAEKIFERVKASPALIAENEVATAERNFQSWGVTRRTALVFLSKSGKELIEKTATDREFAIAVAAVSDEIHAFAAYLKDFHKMIEHADVRLMMALANREDMDAILAEARRGQKTAEADHVGAR